MELVEKLKVSLQQETLPPAACLLTTLAWNAVRADGASAKEVLEVLEALDDHEWDVEEVVEMLLEKTPSELQTAIVQLAVCPVSFDTNTAATLMAQVDPRQAEPLLTALASRRLLEAAGNGTWTLDPLVRQAAKNLDHNQQKYLSHDALLRYRSLVHGWLREWETDPAAPAHAADFEATCSSLLTDGLWVYADGEGLFPYSSAKLLATWLARQERVKEAYLMTCKWLVPKEPEEPKQSFVLGKHSFGIDEEI